MKRFFLWTLIILACVLASVSAIKPWLEKEIALPWLEKFTFIGRPMRLSTPPRLGLFPPRLELSGVTWQIDSGGWNVSFACESVMATPVLASLAHGRVELAELILEKPKAYVEKSLAAANVERQRAAADTPGHTPKNASVKIQKLEARDGFLRASLGGQVINCEDLMLRAENLGEKTNMSVESACALSGEVGGLPLSGAFSSRVNLRHYAPNLTIRDFQATFTASGASGAASFWRSFSPVETRLDGACDISRGFLKVAAATIKCPEFTLVIGGDADLASALFQGRVKLEVNSGDGGDALVADAPMSVDANGIRINDASINYGGLRAGCDFNVWPNKSGKLADFSCALAGGQAKGALDWNGGAFNLDFNGREIMLGDILAQAGVPGFMGGEMSFAGKFRFAGATPAAMRGSVSGGATLQGKRLALEPFGEIGLLLPLLGVETKAGPSVMDSLDIEARAKDGLLTVAPIVAKGDGVSGTGSCSISLLNGDLDGALRLSAFGMELPVTLGGNLKHPEIQTGAIKKARGSASVKTD